MFIDGKVGTFPYWQGEMGTLSMSYSRVHHSTAQERGRCSSRARRNVGGHLRQIVGSNEGVVGAVPRPSRKWVWLMNLLGDRSGQWQSSVS